MDLTSFISISDSYDNNAMIIYDNNRITKVVDMQEREILFEYNSDGLLCEIKDFCDRVTQFEYVGGRLVRIIYPNGEVSEYQYTSNRLSKMFAPSQLGIRLSYTNNQVTKVEKISRMNLVQGERINKTTQIHVDHATVITYSPNGWNSRVTNAKTGEFVEYQFVGDELVHSHIRNEFEQNLVTEYFAGNFSYNVLITQELKGENPVPLRNTHAGWALNPRTLPREYHENLDWTWREYNDDLNVIRENRSDRKINDIAITSRREFDYNSNKLLVRERLYEKRGTEQERRRVTEYTYNKQKSLIRTQRYDSHVEQSDYDDLGNYIKKPVYDTIVAEYTHDEKGNIIQTSTYHKSRPGEKFIQQSETSENGQIRGEYDETGRNKTQLEYLRRSNKVAKSIDPRGYSTVFGHDFESERLKSLSSQAEGTNNLTSYAYAADYLTALESGNTKFEYTYDQFGRKSGIKLNGREYAKYSHKVDPERDVYDGQGPQSVEMVLASYASGEVYKTITDRFGRLLAVNYVKLPLRKVEGVPPATVEVQDGERVIVKNFYQHAAGPNMGRLVQTLDYRIHETTTYTYDNEGRITDQTITGMFHEKKQADPERYGDIPAQFTKVAQSFNMDGGIESLSHQVDERKMDYEFRYKDTQLREITLPTKAKVNIEGDKLERHTTAEIVAESGITLVKDEISYAQFDEHATNLVNIHTQKVGDGFNRTRYSYDPNGNIIEVRDGFNQVIKAYEYDALNRLVKETEKDGIESETGYDNNGNILFKKTGDEVTRYRYDGDQLVSFNGEKFEYDRLGNPVKYRDKTLEWSHLRNLDKWDAGTNDEVEFKYNMAGLRTYKRQQRAVPCAECKAAPATECETCSQVLYESYYHWAGDKLLSETRTETTNEWTPSSEPTENFPDDLTVNTATTTLDYVYGADDSIIGFIKDANFAERHVFYFAKNLQGDVEKILDSDGQVVAEYRYDAWGNCEIVSSVNGIAELSPIRYRSMYIDQETGLYYLKSRYYDSQTGRFISPDAIEILDVAKNHINGLNLYAYSFNNWVNMVDDTGMWPRWWKWDKILVSILDNVSAIVGAIESFQITKFLLNRPHLYQEFGMRTTSKWLRGMSAFGKAGRVLGGVALFLNSAMDIVRNVQGSATVSHTVASATTTLGFDLAIVWASATIGATIGSLIPIPIIGTIIGATIGLAVGLAINFFVNWEIFGGKSITGWTIYALDQTLSWVGEQVNNVKNKNFWKSLSLFSWF